MKIKAAVVPTRAAPFEIDTLDLTDPRPDELLVEVAASGLCATDLHGRDGYYDMPFRPYSAMKAPAPSARPEARSKSSSPGTVS